MSDPTFAADLAAFQTGWDATEEPTSFQMDEAADLAQRALGLLPAGHPDAAALTAALDHWASLDEHDLDAALDLVRAINTASLPA